MSMEITARQTRNRNAKRKQFITKQELAYVQNHSSDYDEVKEWITTAAADEVSAAVGMGKTIKKGISAVIASADTSLLWFAHQNILNIGNSFCRESLLKKFEIGLYALSGGIFKKEKDKKGKDLYIDKSDSLLSIRAVEKQGGGYESKINLRSGFSRRDLQEKYKSSFVQSLLENQFYIAEILSRIGSKPSDSRQTTKKSVTPEKFVEDMAAAYDVENSAVFQRLYMAMINAYEAELQAITSEAKAEKAAQEKAEKAAEKTAKEHAKKAKSGK